MLADSLKNIFAVSDLRWRVFFTLGLLAVYRVGGHIPTPGVNSEALALMADQAKNTMFGLYDMFSGEEPVADDDLRARHHAVYQRVDHPAAPDRRLAVPRAPVEGRGARPPEDHAVHALRHDRAEHRPGARHRALSRAPDQHRRRAAAGLQPGLGLPPDDRPDPDDGHGVHHVARRADHRARHRQRHVAHHLRGDRRQLAARGAVDPGSDAPGPDGHHPGADPRRPDGARRGGHHLRRARAPARDGAVREAGRRAADVRRIEHAHPAEGEHAAASSRSSSPRRSSPSR